jgi:hypothetical protein
MTKKIEPNYEGVEQQPLSIFTENAYLNYSMYVILDRALPNIGDGLKPVQHIKSLLVLWVMCWVSFILMVIRPVTKPWC